MNVKRQRTEDEIFSALVSFFEQKAKKEGSVMKEILLYDSKRMPI